MAEEALNKVGRCRGSCNSERGRSLPSGPRPSAPSESLAGPPRLACRAWTTSSRSRGRRPSRWGAPAGSVECCSCALISSPASLEPGALAHPRRLWPAAEAPAAEGARRRRRPRRRPGRAPRAAAERDHHCSRRWRRQSTGGSRGVWGVGGTGALGCHSLKLPPERSLGEALEQAFLRPHCAGRAPRRRPRPAP